MKLTTHLEGNKSSQLINMLLHLIANSADANSLLTAEGQVAYNAELRRLIYRTNSAVRHLLHNADIFAGDLGNIGNVNNMSNLLAEAAATATAINNLRNEMLTAINNGGIVTESFDASVATAFPAAATLNKRYRVTVAGTVRGVELAFGDLFYPAITNASTTDITNWLFVQGNVDAANDSTFGLVKLAPKTGFQNIAALTAQMNANPNSAINLYHLRELWYKTTEDIFKNGALVLHNITVGTNTVIHNLGPDVLVQVQDNVGNTLIVDFQSNLAGTGITFNSLAAFASAKFTFWKPINSINPVQP